MGRRMRGYIAYIKPVCHVSSEITNLSCACDTSSSPSSEVRGRKGNM
jgi:hypothetical protein